MTEVIGVTPITASVSKRTDAPFRSGPSNVQLKSKNPASEAVRREREEEWRQARPGLFDPIVLFSGAAWPSIYQAAMGVGFGGYGQETALWVPALIVPPDPLAPLKEWQSYRAGLDALEARLLVSHLELDWLDGLRAFKAEGDAVIARHRAERRKPG